MVEAKKEFVRPLEVDQKDRIEPMTFQADGVNFKVYVDKMGYPWVNDAGTKDGVAERVRISIGKLDRNGDVIGQKKQINLPAQLSEKDFQKIFQACTKASKLPLLKAE